MEYTQKQKTERLNTALQCTFEIESIARHLNGNLPVETEYMFLRSMVLRIVDLNSVAMSVLDGDDSRTTAEMLDVINGGANGS